MKRVDKVVENQAKLRWGCRRGMLELDMILLPFYDNHFSCLTAQQQYRFAELLTSEDQDLFAWLIGVKSVDVAELSEIVKLIRDKR